jgi:hypothetical protein
MAKCLAEYKPRFSPLEPNDAPVLAQLRLAIGSSDRELVSAAAFGLTQTATAEDVKAMVSAAERLPSLKTLITGARTTRHCQAATLGLPLSARILRMNCRHLVIKGECRDATRKAFTREQAAGQGVAPRDPVFASFARGEV